MAADTQNIQHLTERDSVTTSVTTVSNSNKSESAVKPIDHDITEGDDLGKKVHTNGRKTGPVQKARETFGWFWSSQNPIAAQELQQRKVQTQASRAREKFLRVGSIF